MPVMAQSSWWTPTRVSPVPNQQRPTSLLTTALSSAPSSAASSLSSSPVSIPSPSKRASKSKSSTKTPASRSKQHAGPAADNSSATTTTTTFTVTVTPIKPTRSLSISSASTTTSESDDAASIMSKGRTARRLPPASPPSSTTVLTKSQTGPVQIPRSSRDSAHTPSRHSSQRKPAKKPSRHDAVSPSVAALLAVTDIPRHRQSSKRPRRQQATPPLTVDDVLGSEKELDWSLGKSPLDVLLTPPEEPLADDYLSASESNVGSVALSIESMPSLGDSFATDTALSLETPPLRRAISPIRKSLEPIRSPVDLADEHPLAGHDDDMDIYDDDSDSAMADAVEETAISLITEQFRPLKAVFKSNLTASLRALRSAAKSFSNMNFSVPPDDLITRSILTMDPKVPYADERRPPVTQDVPSAEMRRYLNPTTRTRVEEAALASAAPVKAAPPPSIQMQTYKVQRNARPSSRSIPATSPQTGAAPPLPPRAEMVLAVPGVRQREMRENPDFIRIAVMEMAMRRSGKLDDRKPGRARWALPPRKAAAKEYQVGDDGVPVRWVPSTVT